MMVRLIAAALLLAATSAEALLAELQRAVARDDRQAVAALIRYPITIAVAGMRIPIRDSAALVQTYEAVFTPEIKAAIGDGSAIRTKLIQVTSVGGVVKISSIASLPPSGADRNGATARAVPRTPRRLTFGAPQQLAQATGALPAGGSEAFVAYVEKGKLLEARIDRVRDQEVVLRVVDARTGSPIDDKAAAGARTWIGRVPESGDYRIDVSRGAQAPSQSLQYLLVVRKR
jgi:hypothetical protein